MLSFTLCNFDVNDEITLVNLMLELNCKYIPFCQMGSSCGVDITFYYLNSYSTNIPPYIDPVSQSYIIYVTPLKLLPIEIYNLQPFAIIYFSKKNPCIKSVLENHIARLHRNYFSCCIKGSTEYITYEKIIYFESFKRKVKLYCINSFKETYAKLCDIEKKAPNSFIRIHQSYLINKSYLKKIEKDKVQLYNGDYLPISLKYKQNVKALLK